VNEPFKCLYCKMTHECIACWHNRVMAEVESELALETGLRGSQTSADHPMLTITHDDGKDALDTMELSK
jgi:hypothetical protein